MLKGHDVPDSAFRLPPSLAHTLAALVTVAVLSGCMSSKKAADTAQDSPAPTSEADAPQGLLAKGGTTASNRYVDPVIVKASSQQQARASLPASSGPKSAPLAAGPYPPAPALAAPAAPSAPAPAPGAASGSIAGLATQPTGVRAGSVSIFSAAPAPAGLAPAGLAPAPQNPAAAAPAGGINAATGSVFSTRQPLGAAPCQTDSAGRPVNC